MVSDFYKKNYQRLRPAFISFFLCNFILFILFVIAAYSDGILNNEYRYIKFENIKFFVYRPAPKGGSGEGRVGLFRNGERIFSASCYELRVICNASFYEKFGKAKVVEVIEVSKGRGAIKYIHISEPSDFVFNNNFVGDYKNKLKRDYFGGFLIGFLVSLFSALFIFLKGVKS